MLVLLPFLLSSLKITAIYEVRPFMLRRSEPTFRWDLLSALLRIYSSLIDTTDGPSKTLMKFSRTSCTHKREHTHNTYTHICIYTCVFIYIYIYIHVNFSPISLLYLMLNALTPKTHIGVVPHR